MSKSRMTVRVVCRDKNEKVIDVIEQSIPATSHDVTLLLRREPFRWRIAEALLRSGSAALVVREEKK